MKKLLIVVVIVLLGLNIYQGNRIAKYQYYYESTEAFLDTLNNAYDWVDAYDNYAYYDAVYKLRH